MKYALLIHGHQNEWDALATWSRDDLRNMVNFMHELDKELTDTGELLDAQGLSGPAQARTVQAGQDGDTQVIDGLPADKEFLIGYWLVDVTSPERAVEIAARISATPGPGGAPVNQPVELHPVGQPPEL